MVTLVFVFMLLNLTSIWKLPTLLIGGRGYDGVPRMVGPGVGVLHPRSCSESGPRNHLPVGQPPAMIPSPTEPDSPVSHLPSQSDCSPPYPVDLNLACIVLRDVLSPIPSDPG